MCLISAYYIRLSFFLFLFSFSTLIALNGQVIANEELDKTFSSIDFKSIYYPGHAQEEFDSLKNTFSVNDLNTYRGYLDYLQAQLFFSELEIDSTLNYLEHSISFFTKFEDNGWLAKCQFLLGRISEATGLMEQAKINYYKTISLGGDTEKMFIGFAYLGIARCKNALEEQFQEELNIGIEIFREINIEEITLYADFMEQLFKLKSSNSPSKLNDVALKYVNLGLYERAVNVYKVEASSFHALAQYDSAHFYCDMALKVSESYKVGKLIIPALYQFKGVLYFKQQKYSTAEKYFTKSLELYRDNKQSSRMLYAYSYLHKIDSIKENYAKAYENLNEYLLLMLETSVKEKVRLAKVLEINNKVDLMKGQLVQLKVEKKASEFMLYLVVVITVLILGGVGIYIYLYQKNKKAKIEELNKEFHNLLIGIGEKQLLEHRLNQGTRRRSVDVQSVKSSPMVDDSEGDIGDSFDTCYMETINLFTDSFPQLTKTEVRYSVMICLKLPMEVIAKVQNVQPGSIRKAKQRIRTKLNVEDNLEVYLQEFREKQISDLAS